MYGVQYTKKLKDSTVCVSYWWEMTLISVLVASLYNLYAGESKGS
jgi:hypothetical protein